jgi:putative transposase
MIEQLSVQYRVKDCCVVLGVSRSGYYQWKKEGESLGSQRDAELGEKIEVVFRTHRGRYGSPRVTRTLRAEGERVGKNRVARLMRQKQLAARRKRAFRPRTTQAESRAEPNRVSTMETTGPDQVWVSDITYVATAEGWLYLAVILDLFSRRVVGWKLGESLGSELVGTALQNALLFRQPPRGLIFHSDRGCQYSSQVVRRSLRALGVLQSMSAQGNCYDNARAEAFFSSLKTECLPLNNCFASKAQARCEIFEYIEIYYNNQRLHSALAYQTPKQYEAAWKAEKAPFSKRKEIKKQPIKSRVSVSL